MSYRVIACLDYYLSCTSSGCAADNINIMEEISYLFILEFCKFVLYCMINTIHHGNINIMKGQKIMNYE